MALIMHLRSGKGSENVYSNFLKEVELRLFDVTHLSKERAKVIFRTRGHTACI